MNLKLKYIDIKASLILLGIVISWATTPLFIHQFSREKITVWDQNFYRYMITVILLWITVWFRYFSRTNPDYQKLTLPLWRKGLNPVLPAVGAQVFFAWSLYYLQPGLMAILHKQCVIWAAMFSMVYFHDERKLLGSWEFWIGLLCGLAGAVGVVFFGKDKLQGQWQGVLLVMIFALCWSIYHICIKNYIRHIDSTRGCSIVMTFGLIPVALLAWILGKPCLFTQLPQKVLVLLFLSSVFNLYLPHVGIYWVIRRVGVTITQTALLGTAFVTAIFSWIIYSEKLSSMQWVSGLVLIFGAILVLTAQRYMQKNN